MASPQHGGDPECPFVVAKYGLASPFWNQLYGLDRRNTVYALRNPWRFGVGDDRYRLGTVRVAAPELVFYRGKSFIAMLNARLDVIRVVGLR